MAETQGLIDQIIAAPAAEPQPVIHVRYDGRSEDLTMANLDIGPLSPDDRVKEAVAQYFQVPASKLSSYDVVREPNGNLTLRPVANFG